MQAYYLEFILAFSTTFITLLIFYWWYKIPRNLPPGPIGLPLLGNVIDFKLARDEVSVLEKWVKSYGPIFKFYMGTKLIVVLANYEVIEQSLIKQGECFSGRPILTALYIDKFHGQRTGFLLTDGEKWKEQRRFALSTLRDCGMGKSSLQQSVQETAEILVKELQEGAGKGPVDILDRMNKAVSNIICSLAFGKTYEGEEFWSQLKSINFRVSESGISFLSPMAYFPWLKKVPLIRKRYDAYFNALNGTLDFVNGLIKEIFKSQDVHGSGAPVSYVNSFFKAQSLNTGKYFTDNEMVASVNQLFAAGVDTTSTTLRFGIYYLALNKNVQERMFQEICSQVGLANETLNWEDRSKLPYIEACIMEIQRVSNLLPFSLMHRTLTDTNLMGYSIPADTLIIPFLGAVLNESKYFPDPSNFDPNRFLNQDGTVKRQNAWIPFSTGKRICLGESLAKMELFIFLTALIMRFRFSFPEEWHQTTIERKLGFVSHPKNYKICISLREHCM